MKRYLLNVLQNILANLARKVIKKNHVEIISITGSVGKTSTREAIYQVLRSKFGGQVRESQGNLNNEIGFPLAILGFNQPPIWWQYLYIIPLSYLRAMISSLNPLTQTSILILEYAADKPGDISYLTSIAKPNVAIITKIGFAHTQDFGSLDGVAKEKAKLVEVLASDGYAILNKDDVYTGEIKSKTKARVVYFSDKKFDTHKEIAQVVGKIYGVDDKDSEKILANIKSLKGRLNIIRGIRESKIIDDTYNANPTSCRLALKYLAEQSGRKIAVLGDMLELGKVELEEHKNIAKLAREISDIFIAIGERYKSIESDRWFSDPLSAGKYLLSEIKKNDIILVKGSQGMRMEKVVEKIIAEPQKARELLVRQDSEWKKKPFKLI